MLNSISSSPMLVALGFTADDEMLFSMLEAYAWCLEYPESVRRFAGDERSGWPPRIVFVAERVAETFLRKLRLLKFPAVHCFEFRYVDVNGATGFYLDVVDWSRSSSPRPRHRRPRRPPRRSGCPAPRPSPWRPPRSPARGRATCSGASSFRRAVSSDRRGGSSSRSSRAGSTCWRRRRYRTR